MMLSDSSHHGFGRGSSTRAITATAFLAASILGIGSAQGQSLLSQTTWGGPDSEVTEGIALAPDGGAILVGRTRSFFTNHGSIFLLKFSPDGATLCGQRVWEAPNMFVDDTAADVAVGVDGSAYVAGTTLGVRGDALLLKFDATGALVWQRTWGRDANSSENAEAVATAADGSVYLVGGTTNPDTGASGLVVLKFAGDGTLVWAKTWDASGGGQPGVAVSPDGFVYVVGTVARPNTSFQFDMLVLKIAPADGSVVWQRAYAAGDIVDARGGVAVALDGSVYVAGGLQQTAHGFVDLDAVLVKLAPDGSLLWDRTGGGGSGDSPAGVAVAPDGSVYLAGQTNSFAVGSDDAFVVRFLPSGKTVEALTWGGADLDGAAGVAVAADGTVVLGATANIPPYSLLSAPRKVSRPHGSLSVAVGSLVDVAGTVSDPGGSVSVPNGTTTYAGSFDAALVRITP